MTTLWHGRFEGGPSPELLAFSESLSFDRRLAADDIDGSRAHVRGLIRAGIITPEEGTTVLAALDRVAVELARWHARVPAVRRGRAHRDRAAGHRARRRGRRQAPHRPEPQRPGGHRLPPLHQARAPRRGAAGARASSGCSSPEPRRPASPTCPATPTCSGPSRCCSPTTCSPTAGPWRRDIDRLLDTRRRLDVSPLGAGALAGSSLPLDPAAVAEDLGFAAAFENSLDATSDRDFVAEALFDLALLGVHLSRHRRGGVPVGHRRVRVPPPGRSLVHRIVDAARRRRTPTSPSSRAARPGA